MVDIYLVPPDAKPILLMVGVVPDMVGVAPDSSNVGNDGREFYQGCLTFSSFLVLFVLTMNSDYIFLCVKKKYEFQW